MPVKKENQFLDDDEREVVKSGAKFGLKWIVIGGLGLIAAGAVFAVVGGVFKTATTAATAPGRVIQQTLETDNIINNYEWFHDVHAAWQAKQGQIATHKDLVNGATSDGEKSRLNIELAAMKQTCRELVTEYNANSTKSNREIFKGTEAPEELILDTCE